MRRSKLVFLFVLVIFLAGCLSTRPFTPPPECTDQASLILKATDGNPTGLSDALLVINIVALDAIDDYETEDARKVIDDVRSMVTSGITYADLQVFLIKKVTEANRTAGVTVFVLGPSIAQIGNEGGGALVGLCDAALINLHLDKQEKLLLF